MRNGIPETFAELADLNYHSGVEAGYDAAYEEVEEISAKTRPQIQQSTFTTPIITNITTTPYVVVGQNI